MDLSGGCGGMVIAWRGGRCIVVQATCTKHNTPFILLTNLTM